MGTLPTDDRLQLLHILPKQGVLLTVLITQHTDLCPGGGYVTPSLVCKDNYFIVWDLRLILHCWLNIEVFCSL